MIMVVYSASHISTHAYLFALDTAVSPASLYSKSTAPSAASAAVDAADTRSLPPHSSAGTAAAAVPSSAAPAARRPVCGYHLACNTTILSFSRRLYYTVYCQELIAK